MGLFRRAKQEENFDDPLLDDGQWLRGGEDRYDRLISNHYGSPDTIAHGGDLRKQRDDYSAALYFYQKAVDTMHSIYVCGSNDRGPGSWSRRPGPADMSIVDRYIQTLQWARTSHPNAPLSVSVKEVTHRLRTISTAFGRWGLNPEPWQQRLALLGATTPDIDVSDVFWS